MNIPLSWLKEHVDINVPIRQFMEDITMTGTTAESFTALGADIDKVVVGRIEAIEKHPNADKLLITQVNTGGETPLQIVTGALNLQVGDYVPVAVHGASLAGGLTIKKGKLRGETSEGMLCSIEELGYTNQDYPEAPEDGIYVFETPQPLGVDVKPILQLVDDVVEFELYSSRPDCQSLFGIAREVAATYGQTFTPPSIMVKEEAAGHASDFIEVEIQNPDLCPRYVARVVKDVRIGPSPQWLRRRLISAGVRPINNIVDITNYIMLEYGQPLHAFDIDDIAQRKIIVRTAGAGEKITTLDGTVRILDETMLVIADPEKAVAIAGIMGGENSKVTGGASAVLFEAAGFDGTNIRLSSKKLGMRTDASAKFEKGLDPNLPLLAVNRAMELVEMLCCGQVVTGVVDNYPRPRNNWTVAYKPENINRLLGTDISNHDMETFLARIDIKAKDGQALIPTFRPDITCEADIAEEVARFYGYNNIPVNKSQRNITGGAKNAYQRGEDTVKRTMAALGYSEALTSSFEGPKVLDKLGIGDTDEKRQKAVTITNPLGEDFSILRTTPLHGMLHSLSINFNRRNEIARLFELTKVYLTRHKENPGTLPEEKIYLTIGAYSRKNPGLDFFDIKGDIEEFMRVLGIKHFSFMPNTDTSHMHPGRTATIIIDGESPNHIGYVGELHPDMAEAYEIGTRAYIAVLELAPLIDGINNVITYVPLPKYPTISRDIALQVKEDIPAAVIEKTIREKAGSLLVDLSLFDIYQGKQIEEGYKSMAYALSFRAVDRTLTDEEVAAPMEAVLKHLKASLNVRLRDK